jgi:excisionase family DNA binding protein
MTRPPSKREIPAPAARRKYVRAYRPVALSDSETPDGSGAENWLTFGEACDYLGVSKNTLERWIKEGRIINVQKTSSGWRLFNRQALTQLRTILEADTVIKQEPIFDRRPKP